VGSPLSRGGVGLTLATAVLGVLSAPVFDGSGVAAQDASVDAYLGGLAGHFGLPAAEVRVLSEWDIEPEEVAVVLFLAEEGGVSSDALIALHRAGRSWTQLAERYGMHAGTFHVPLAESASAGPLSAAYERFRGTPRAQWSSIDLDEDELVQLVNLKVLSDYLNVPPGRVVGAWEQAGSFVGAYGALVRSGG
jgi:hypothetical protein